MPSNAILVAGAKRADASSLRQQLAERDVKNPLILFGDGVDLMTFLRSFVATKTGGGNPVLLLLDLDLPKVNGLEILLWLREKSELKDLRVILLADNVDPKDVKRAAPLGVREFRAKHASPAVRAEAIAKALRDG